MLNIDDVWEMISYEPDTGLFRWLKDMGPKKAGEIAGSNRKDGYWRIKIAGREYQGANLAWFIMTGRWPAAIVDHRDMDKRNNRWDNLREATPRQNQGNKRVSEISRSQVKGVDFHKGRWRARIRMNGRRHELGHFATIEEAAIAYRYAAIDYFGEFART